MSKKKVVTKARARCRCANSDGLAGCIPKQIKLPFNTERNKGTLVAIVK